MDERVMDETEFCIIASLTRSKMLCGRWAHWKIPSFSSVFQIEPRAYGRLPGQNRQANDDN